MAYSGLGDGTIGDPFQITTIPQLKETNNYSLKVTSAAVFTGTGLNNATSSGVNADTFGAVYTITINGINGIKTSTLNNGGTGYAVNDTFTISGGTAGLLASGKVLTISAGVVLTYSILTYGSGYSITNGLGTTATLGIGTGLIVNVTALQDDTFLLNKAGGGNPGDYPTAIITAAVQNLSYYGIKITFATKTGHTVGDKWVITCTVPIISYWKLMNDLDFTAETSFLIAGFTEKLDGNGYSLLNVPIGAGGIGIQNYCSINNLTIRCTRLQGGSTYSIFPLSATNYLGISLTNLHIVISGNAYLSYISNSAWWDTECVLSHIVVEGDIRGGFTGQVNCVIEHVKILHTTKHVISSTAGVLVGTLAAEMRYCQVIAPIVSIEGNAVSAILVYNLTGGGTIKESFVASNAAANFDSTYTFAVAHGLVAKGYSTGQIIQDCYYVGNFSVNKGEELNNSYGNAGKSGYIISPHDAQLTRRCYFDGNLNSPLNTNRTILVKEYNTAGNYVQNCFYNKTKLVDTVAKNIAGQQNGLTSTEFLNSANFTGYDFATIWQMGATAPFLRNNPIYAYESPARAMDIATVIRTSSTHVSVNLNLGVFDNSIYGVDVLDGATLVFNSQGVISNDVVVNGTADVLYTIKPYWFDVGVKNYLQITTYQHYCYDSAVNSTTIVADAVVPLTGTPNANYIHGSCMYNGYIYGSARNKTGGATQTGCIVKYPITNIASYTIIPIYVTSEGVGWSAVMDGLVVCGNYLYTLACRSDANNTYLIQFNPADDTYKVFLISGNFNFTQPIITDGQYLYITLSDSGAITKSLISKVDPAVFIGAYPKFNTSSVFSFANLGVYDDSTQGGHIAGGYESKSKGYIHTAVVDSNNLYLGYTSTSGGITDANGYAVTLNKTLHELQVVNKNTMTAAGWVNIPKATDDMCQTNTHLFFGVEIQAGADTRTFGYGWGTFAIRKSDLRLTSLPRLHSVDKGDGTSGLAGLAGQSYASLIFGNYLLDSKSNVNTYILDITDVDNWLPTEPIGKRTIKNYNYTYAGAPFTSTQIPNEFMLSEETGKFYAFLWGGLTPLSSAMQANLTGLSYFSVPTINTVSSVVVGTGVTLSGYILNNGGKVITSKGFHYGISSDALTTTITNSDSTSDFQNVISGLAIGIYYYQAFAINNEGESIAEIKSFIISSIPNINTSSSVVVGTSVTLTGSISSAGGLTITSRGFHYGGTADTMSNTITSTDITSEFTSLITGLAVGTYYYQAFAINSNGESAAAVSSFTIAISVPPCYVGSSKVKAIYLGSVKIDKIL